ncbi:MbcA/ParS/Xre antitoxin family protein [Sediminitomix flava]|nr:MbcA/ParS/Xre antitoxin family protein [Sediminitomix flava]
MAKDSQVFNFISEFPEEQESLLYLFEISGWSKTDLSELLNISTSELNNYLNKKRTFKSDIQERVVYLIGLVNQGHRVFASVEGFNKWLKKDNVYLDWNSPYEMAKRLSSIALVCNMLNSLEFGDLS